MEPDESADRAITGTDRRPAAPADREPADHLRLVTLAEAAAMTGQRMEAIRSRIRRKTLNATRGNHGQWMVHADDLATGRPRPTRADHLMANRSRPGPTETVDKLADHQPADHDLVTDRLLTEAERRRADAAEARLASVEVELRDAREVATTARIAEAITLAELTAERRRADAAEARLATVDEELREARRPLWEKLARAIRRRD